MKPDYKTRLKEFENEKKSLLHKDLPEFEYIREIKKLADKYDI